MSQPHDSTQTSLDQNRDVDAFLPSHRVLKNHDFEVLLPLTPPPAPAPSPTPEPSRWALALLLPTPSFPPQLSKRYMCHLISLIRGPDDLRLTTSFLADVSRQLPQVGAESVPSATALPPSVTVPAASIAYSSSRHLQPHHHTPPSNCNSSGDASRFTRHFGIITQCSAACFINPGTSPNTLHLTSQPPIISNCH